MKNPKLSLSIKALSAVAIILLPILFTFIMGYRSNKELLTNHFLEDLTLIAESIEGQVYQFIEMGRSRAVDLSSDGLIRSELAQAGRPGWSPAGLNSHLISNKLPLNTQLRAIAVVSPLGKVLSSTESSLIGTDISGERFFKADGGINVAARRSGVYGPPDLAFAAPVVTRGGETLGFVVNFVNLSDLGSVLTGELSHRLGAMTSRLYRRDTFESYLVNSDRFMITGSRFVSDAVFSQKVETEPVAACLERGQELTGFYTDYRGVEVAGASMCLPKLGWTLLTEIGSSEALMPISAIGKYAAFTALVVAFLIALLFVAFRKIVLELQGVSRAAAEIARGNYDAGIPVRSGDEIGELARSFNDMALQIRERSASLEHSEQRLKAILDNSSAVVYLKDLEGRYLFVNRQFESLFRTADKHLLGRTDHDVFPREVAYSIAENDRKAIESGSLIEFEETIPQDNGLHTYISMKFPLYAAGKPYAVCGFSTDITERKHMETSLKQSAERLKRAQALALMGSWEWEVPNNVLWWSDEIYDIFGCKPQEFGATYEAFLGFVHPDDREFVKNSVEHALYDTKPYSIEHRIVLPDGTEKIVHEKAEVLTDEVGRPLRMIGTVQDLTERRRAEFELKKLSAIIEHSVNLVFITDKKGSIQYVNPTFEQVTGFTREDALGQTPRILSSGEVTNAQYQELWNTILSGKTWRSTFKNRKKNGGYYWATTVITPIKNDRGEITNFLSVQEDVTEKMQKEERLNYLASHDELTGLINRASFIEQVGKWIESAGHRSATGALCILDMDQFKLLNDTFGHGAGDEYLRRIANILHDRLEEICKNSPSEFDQPPVLSRLSGDEFAIFLPGISEERGVELTESLRSSVEGFYFTEASSTMTVSAGMALYPDHGIDIKDLLTKSDAAMYRAKELGRNRIHVYRPEDRDLEKMHSRLSWREKIFKGLREDRFVPWFQPLLDLNENRVHHYEALARLISEDGLVLLPGAFIDIAERFGIIGLIDRVIIEKTMRTQAEMRRLGKDISFGMNLSGKELGDADLLDFIKSKIIETGADPAGLVFEITETAAIGDLEKATRFVKSLKEIGCQFSLDDFGVGFTSFTYLKEMQVDFIKIDGSFIRKLHENPSDQVFVKAITDLARGLKIESIAEFVENEQTLELLRSFGVDYAQGYFIGKPSPTLPHNGPWFNKKETARVV
ncbi:MAG TPA: hypothetical protein DDW94_06600 [Deltaproteobacteria bacterium]|nr:MAG: hypothetical protein A2Z79_01130 [Deltaproteobacteria bacterium GWA2_55_82]OIJ74039.1 MAG: hypothetical protein A2V21_307040 [Deltaproteobacteria bacterium GWC2_55_46]HBG46647.1 hypothetical protein [Deltaproteobacteria bacterium]HCY11345.1 hypothetical protein [Deltaproteobacteria bacterium]